MARTYASVPVLSKVKIGDSTYFLKDADVRGLLDSIPATAWAAIVAGLDEPGGFVSEPVVGGLEERVAALEALPKFEVIIVEALPKAGESTMHKIYLMAASQSGVQQNVYKEYITVRSGQTGSYTYAWEMIGDTALDLSGYVTDVKWSGHTLQQKKGANSYVDIHAFGNMADADTASATVSDYVTGVSSAKVTAAGSVSKPDIDVTPTNGTIQVIDSVGSPTVIDVTKFNPGSKADDTYVAPSLKAGFYTAGVAPTFTEGAFTANVPTQIDVTKFNAGSKVADTWDRGTLPSLAIDSSDNECLILNPGTLPDYQEGAYTAPSLGNGFYVAGTAAKKSADTFNAGSQTVVDVTKFDAGSFTYGAYTAPSLEAGFYTAGIAPTKKNQTVLASVAAELHNAPTFTGSEVDATVTLAKGSKTIQVSPDPKA